MTKTNNFKMAGLGKRWLMTCMLLACCAWGAFGQNVTVSGASVGNGTYATLQAAFAAINVAGNNGSPAIDVLVHANTTETGTAVLDNFTWSSVTVRCTSAVTIQGSITGAIVKLNGTTM
ncbi:MAG: hypothetical protein IPO27_03940 [Bacteroidetes bacterium]|nr:hypothetical protein [Bacteroidota bacterium]